jgi:hypothetical protein
VEWWNIIIVGNFVLQKKNTKKGKEGRREESTDKTRMKMECTCEFRRNELRRFLKVLNLWAA